MSASHYLINEVHTAAAATGSATRGFFGHRLRRVTAHDGEILSVTVGRTDPQLASPRITMAQTPERFKGDTPRRCLGDR